MTPQERELVADLFARLAELERNPRDPDAEQVMREGLRRAPNALYPLVQTALLQDEALRVANDRIADLEDALAQAERNSGRGEQPRGGFLDSMRDTFLGRDEPQRGSVPRTGQPTGQPMGVPAGYGRDEARAPWAQDRGMPSGGPAGGMPMQGGPGGGGSFLGTAAAAAAGVIGGGLLMNSIRGMMGGQSAQGAQGPFSGAFDQLAGRKPGGDNSNSELARDAGLGDIGQSGGQGGRQGFANASHSGEQTEQGEQHAENEDDESEWDEDDTYDDDTENA